MVEPLFFVAVAAIFLLSGSLFAHDVRAWHATERRLQRCPVRVR